MGSHNNHEDQTALEAKDQIERKLRGATSLLNILSGENRQCFLDMSPDLQDGFIDTLVDLTEDARRSNCRSS